MDKNVLIVDDSLYMRTIIKDTRRQAGYTIVGEAANEERAIDMALTLRPDIITRDNIRPEMIETDIPKVFAKERPIGRAGKKTIV